MCNADNLHRLCEALDWRVTDDAVETLARTIDPLVRISPVLALAGETIVYRFRDGSEYDHVTDAEIARMHGA